MQFLGHRHHRSSVDGSQPPDIVEPVRAKQQRILVVGEEPSVVDAVATSLRFEGFVVDEADLASRSFIICHPWDSATELVPPGTGAGPTARTRRATRRQALK